MEIFRKKTQDSEITQEINSVPSQPEGILRNMQTEDRIFGNSPLHEKEAQPTLLDIFAKNPMFHDYENI
ncbi:hypothetical protein B9Z55_025991 [Caenorhabditis nigoni]|uniref:Uncharacterized protein n=1 Tax=Caenorhabditis nigoni TaxID=1611254 RepID=A0A2G5T138_9PELO|nr:hypothetical protein B9Z55_025991 [Caenorhabditis nigoni]